ncbi:hypothetical protein [Paludisphaera soli]|uniref:hypothetical protein n=1 Tax=Paludisphaera soli TaxID=2712865 RepID=UPI0013EBC87E|nr:hypothetical protein [Paludisphaera soli]
MSRIDDEQFQAFTRTTQIIVGSLAAGVVMFWVIVTVVLSDGGGPKPAAGGGAAGPPILGLPLLTAVSVLFGAVSVVASILVPKLIVDGAIGQMAKGIRPDSTTSAPTGAKQVDPESEADKLLPIYQTQLIIASALNEGGAFLAGIAYMMEGHAAAILVAGVLLALLLSRFPTAERIQAWIAAQLERLAAKRRDDF